MKKSSLFLAFVLLTVLAACSSTDKDKDKEKDTEEKQEEVVEEKKKKLICPQVAIVRELATIRDYGNETPDPSQLVAAARMENIYGDCAYEDEGIDIDFGLNFLAAKGPRLGGDHAGFSYFVAVLDPEQNILNKDRMTIDFRFSEDKKFPTKEERLHIFIPLDKEGQKTGPNYQVLMGFQLTPEQLDALRAKEDAVFSPP